MNQLHRSKVRELRDLLAKAEHPVPWRIYPFVGEMQRGDHELAQAAVNALPELLDRLEKLENERIDIVYALPDKELFHNEESRDVVAAVKQMRDRLEKLEAVRETTESVREEMSRHLLPFINPHRAAWARRQLERIDVALEAAKE